MNTALPLQHHETQDWKMETTIIIALRQIINSQRVGYRKVSNINSNVTTLRQKFQISIAK